MAGGTPKKKRQKKPSRLTRQQKVLVVIAVCLAIVLAVVAACQSLFVRPDLDKKKEEAGKNQDGAQVDEIDYGDGIRPRADGERKSEDYYTVLILGRDTGGGGNTDTMLLASYDVTNQKATVMSIPRDTMVNVSWDVKKINSVYNVNGGGEKGIKALYKEISQLVGFEPDYEVIVEWEAVGKLVDAIGGVYFDVPYDMDYHDPYQDLVIEQAKGYRLLTGDDAMQVIRWRKNDPGSPYGNTSGIGDSGRMEVQQDFLKAVIEQMMKPANVMNIGKIAKVFQECVETDLSFQEILWFGKAAVSGGLSVSSVEFLTMPWYGVSAWSRSYQQKLSYVVPVASELLDIVNNKLSPFVETFSLSDLDIMSVHSDGSIRSTTGYVEDSKAAVPPEIPTDEETTNEPLVNENGDLIDPETGEVVPVDPEGPIVMDPETDEPETDDPGTMAPENIPPVEETPVTPEEALPPEEIPIEEPDVPVESENTDFIIIEPQSAA